MDTDQQIKIFHQYIGKHHEKKVGQTAWKKKSCTKTQACTSKNTTPKQNTFHLSYTFLFLSNLVLKFSIMLIGNFWIIFTKIHSPSYLFINILYFNDLEVLPVLYVILQGPVKLWWGWVFLFKVFIWKFSYFSRKILSW